MPDDTDKIVEKVIASCGGAPEFDRMKFLEKTFIRQREYIDHKDKTIEMLGKCLDACREMLKSLENCGFSMGYTELCPVCHESDWREPKHRPDCELNALLKRLG